MNYNLLDEKWIPVLYRNGEWKRVGIRQAQRHVGEAIVIAEMSRPLLPRKRTAGEGEPC
jgi:hypothetical protein